MWNWDGECNQWFSNMRTKEKEDTNMALTLTVALVTLASGAINETASIQAFEDKLASFKAELETESGTIADAVSAQFDQYPGAGQNMPALCHGALNRLNVQPANYGVMEAKVLQYIRDNSDRVEKKDKKTGAILQAAEPQGTRLFHIKKGVGGGVVRNSDVTAPE
jgi:hypothetical protein